MEGVSVGRKGFELSLKGWVSFEKVDGRRKVFGVREWWGGWDSIGKVVGVRVGVESGVRREGNGVVEGEGCVRSRKVKDGRGEGVFFVLFFI